MSGNTDNADDFNTILAIAIPLLLVVFALHYWKPDSYWNSLRTTNFRHLIGDRVVDILGYT